MKLPCRTLTRARFSNGLRPSPNSILPSPPRYTEATLVKALEENGVGRPSTYASIISTIQDKEYVTLEQRKFEPTDLGKLVNQLLVQHFPSVMNVEFTASMEEKLDQVEEGSIAWLALLKEFYTPFKTTLDLAKKEMKSIKRSAEPTDVPCALCDGKMVIKWGRMGEFLACENYPSLQTYPGFQTGRGYHCTGGQGRAGGVW